MKTILQHLNELKEPYRTQAINNTDSETLEEEALNLAYALLDAFEWELSHEGCEYWDNVHSQIELENEKYFEIQSS